MKKLTTDEFEQLSIKGKGRSSVLFNSIINLKVGEAILIEQKDWNRKASPTSLVRYIEKKHEMKFKCGATIDGTGWAVRRVESLPKEKLQNEKNSLGNKFSDTELLKLKSDIIIYYLGRMAFIKIERIEESLKSTMDYFWKIDRSVIQELFNEIMKTLEEQGAITIENEKAFIPLRRF